MKTGRVTGWHCVVMGMLCGAITARAGIPFPETLEKVNVSLSSMKNGQAESLLLGNGDLYGIVWEKEGGLFMRITKNDIWDARVDTSQDGEMPRVDISSGKLFNPRNRLHSYHTLKYPHPRIATALKLGPVPDAMTAELDIEKAVVTLQSNARPVTTLRILHDRNVLLVDSPHPVVMEDVKSKLLPPAELGTTDGVSWLKMKMPGDQDYGGMEYAVAVASEGSLNAVSVVSSFDSGVDGVLARAIALAKESLFGDNQNRQSVADHTNGLIHEHEQSLHNYWSRSGVQLEDKVMERWWYRVLYFARTVCRPGAYPVALMPPLATDSTPWHADIHHNYNSWQAFWPLPAANQAELADPWITFNNYMVPRYKFLARETYGIEGVHVPISSFLHEPNPADCKSRNRRQVSNSPYGLTIGLQGMTLQSMWQKYLCDQDAAYMKAKIYPYLKETTRFYVNFIEKCKTADDGKIILGPSYSPEHGQLGIYNCPFDIAYVQYTFTAFRKASKVLGADKDLLNKVEKAIKLLPEYPTAPDDKGRPVVVDWQGCTFREVPLHNITVPASPVFPAEQVTWFSPEPVKDLFRNTINVTQHNGNNSHVMFNIAKARLSMMDGYKDGRAWFASRELPNGFFKWQGHGHGTFMGEMIGIAGLINEYLLQSVKNKIRVFPCWPKDKDAKFENLRAQGGFLVSAEQKNGEVVKLEITSTVGGTLQLLSPWRKIVANGKALALDELGLVTVTTTPGEKLAFEGS